jgi:Major Facilitator Superfamily
VLCAFIFVAYDNYLSRAQKRHAPWAEQEEYRRLPLACLGGPLCVIGLFWLSWSAFPQVHWIVPMISGLLFGMGYLLIFMAMLNYLTDAYQVFAASANGIASTCRSIFGALLPLAAKPMYTKLGIHWAGSLLAFISLGMAVIPFVFIRYGDRIRENSRFCQHLKELNEKEAAEEEEEKRRSEMTLHQTGSEEKI